MTYSISQIVSDAETLLNWTPSIGDATVEDFQAAGKFHQLVASNYLRIHGELLKQQSPKTYELLSGYVDQN